MNTNLRFASFAAGLAVGLSCLFVFTGQAVAGGVLPLHVSGEDIEGFRTDALTSAIVAKLGRYPNLSLMPVPPDDPIDVMLDVGCEDLNKECLMLIGKVKGADFVLYTAAANVDGRFRISYRYVEVATGTLLTVDRGAGPGDDPAVFAALVLEEVVGAEPAALIPEVLVNFVSYPSGGEVYVASEFVGITPVTVRLKAGRHDVRMTKNGFEPRAEAVSVDVSRDNTVKWSLNNLPVPVPDPVPVPVPDPVPDPVPVPVPDPAPAAVPAPEPAPVAVAAPVSDVIPVGQIPVEPVAEVKKAPFYKTWWFWTIIGVAVVGAGTAAGVIAAQDGEAGGQVGFSADPGYAPLDVTLFR